MPSSPPLVDSKPSQPQPGSGTSLAAEQPEAPPAPTTGFVPRVFISHSSANGDFGLKLERRLKEALGDDTAVFYDADGGLHGGDEWLKRLQYEIGTRNVFVLILSPQAFSSGWVEKELSYALRRAVSVSGMVLVPVVHRKTEVWPFLNEYQRVDFEEAGDSSHDTEQFEQRFAELLYAVRLGRSRIDEVERMRQIRQGPPYDLAELPVPERFVGRERDVEWALQQVAPETDVPPSSGLASIAAANGLGGIGKSALAGQVARILYATNRFPGGIAVVRCNGLSDPTTVLRRVLARFDPQRSEPQEVELQQLRDLTNQVFATRRALVVLDNVEAGWPVEEVVHPLRVAGAAVLLTSRVRLPVSAVPTEASRMLEILSPDDAIDLFAEYFGRGAKADLTLSEQGQVGRIVKALGYHTLAVKLAAARAKGRDLQVLAHDYESDRRLGVNLEDGTQAVHAILESSLAALSEPGRRLFALLAAFPTTDIGRRAVLAVAKTLELQEPAGSLEAVTDWRMVDTAVDERIAPEADRERLRLHPLVRTYAEEQLARWDEEHRREAQFMVAAWYAEYAEVDAELSLAADEDNVVGALTDMHRYADNEDAQQLVALICSGMAGFWRATGRTQAALDYLPWGMEAAERASQGTGAEKFAAIGAGIASTYSYFLRLTRRLDEAESVTRRVLDYVRADGDRQAEAATLSDLGWIERARGNLAASEQLYRESLAISRESQNRWEEGRSLHSIGYLAQLQGRPDEAEEYYKLAIPIRKEVGDRQGESVTLDNLGQVAEDRERFDEAESYYQQSLAISREIGDRQGEGASLSNLGGLALQRGRLDEAERLYLEGIPIAREVQDRTVLAVSLRAVGEIALAHGRLEEAQRYLEESLTIRREVGDRRGEALTLFRLAQIAEGRGDLDRAENLHRKSLAIAREIAQVQDIADSLRTLGRFLIERRDQQGEGCQMLQEAVSLYEQLGQVESAQDVRALLQQQGCES